MDSRKDRPRKGYTDALGRLYGDGSALVAPHGQSARKTQISKANDTPTEDDEQVRLFTWLDRRGILAFHVPNGGMRNMRYAAKLKRLGLKSGIPDIVIPLPRGCYHGLFIELKRLKGSVVSDTQKYWIEALSREGYAVYVCKGYDAAVKVVEDYLKMV